MGIAKANATRSVLRITLECMVIGFPSASPLASEVWHDHRRPATDDRAAKRAQRKPG
jgi:hypothetical protein